MHVSLVWWLSLMSCPDTVTFLESEWVDSVSNIFLQCHCINLMKPQIPSCTFNEICPPGGKRNEELILPINSSLSVTLHQDQVSKYSKLHLHQSDFTWNSQIAQWGFLKCVALAHFSHTCVFLPLYIHSTHKSIQKIDWTCCWIVPGQWII